MVDSSKQYQAKPVVGVSVCLVGEKVCFDGGHKRNVIVCDQLSRILDYRTYCPEMAIGLSAPHPPIRLLRLSGRVSAVNVRDTSQDYTAKLEGFAQRICAQGLSELDGFIFKKGSPSCGMERVNVYDHNTVPEHNGHGVFAQALMRHDPLLPVEEEGRLSDARLRENFLTRVLVYCDWKRHVLLAENKRKALLEFHTRYKYCLLAHNQVVYRELGRLLAAPNKWDVDTLLREYIALAMNTLKTLPTRASHSNVLMHMAGFFKRHLQSDDKQELLDLITRYRLNRIPIASPLTLLQHYLRLYPTAFLREQQYFQIQYLLMAY